MNKKREVGVLFIFAVVSILVLAGLASAEKGVGLKWTAEGMMVQEGNTSCITYGLYNPWNEDVVAKLEVSNELKEVVSKVESDPRQIKAGTNSQNAIPTDICFKVPENIYKKDCTLGIFCSQTCTQTMKEYIGQVIVTEVKDQTTNTVMGSTSNLGVSAPLKLKVECHAYEKNYTIAYILIVLAVIILIILYIRIKRAKVSPIKKSAKISSKKKK